jgi:hypothetical protein
MSGLKLSSKTLVFLLFAVFVLLRFLLGFTNILSWDTFGYYLYLPALFIYHDPGLTDFQWVQHLMDLYQTTGSFYHAYPGADGMLVIKYPVGWAIAMSPFFFIAHWLAPVLGYAADGFSMPYQVIITLGALLYALSGMLLLRKVLLRFFPDWLTGFVLLLVLAGSNFAQMASDHTLSPHNLLFTAYAAVLYLTIRGHEKPSVRNSVLLGLVTGFIAITRPTDALIVLIPLLWGVWPPASFREKIRMIRTKPLPVLVFVLSGLLAVLPQLFYWKYSSGSFLFYTYQNPGEGLDWMQPHWREFLFSFRKGWLVYTPLMVFALIGLISLARRIPQMLIPLSLFLLLYVYVVSSWTCWWYAGSFSQRPMLQTYPLLALSLACFVEWVFSKKNIFKWTMLTILLVFLALNIFQTWQYTFGKVLHPDRMTKAYYFSVFGKTGVGPEQQKLLLVERSAGEREVLTDTNGLKSRVILFDDFEQDANQENDTLIEGYGRALVLDANHPFSPGVSSPFKELTSSYYAWIRLSCMVYPLYDLKENPVSLVQTFEHKGQSYKYLGTDLADPLLNVKPGQWNVVSMDYMTPEVRSKEDILKAYVWLRGQQPVLIDNLKVEVFEPED